MFAARTMMLSKSPAAAAVVAFDANIGTPLTGLGSSPSGTFTAASGADVFVAISTAASSSHSISSITYDGNAMTLVGSLAHNSTSANGKTFLYRAAAAGTGTSKTVAVTFSTSVYYCINATSYTGVASIGTATTHFGNSTSPSTGSVSCVSGEMILAVIGSGGTTGTALTSPSGGTGRCNVASSPAYAALVVRDSTSTATFSATLGATVIWSTVELVLSP